MLKRPLRICMITTFYPPYSFGGDGIYVQRLAHELADRGHHVEVIHCIDAYRALARKDPLQGGPRHPQVTVHGLCGRAGVLSVLLTHQIGTPVLQSRRIRRILDRGFDVIHYHNVSLVGGAGILRYGRALKLYTMHEYWLVCPTHVLFKFNREVCRRKQCLRCSLRYRRPPQWWRYTGLLRSAVAHVDAFIAYSRFSKTKHDELMPGLPIVCLPPFVPDAADSTDPSSGQGFSDLPESYFLFAGRLEKLKGLHTLVPVFREFERTPLLVAGTGTYQKDLRAMAAASHARFLGQCTQAQLTFLLRNALALVVPSICFEASPLVIVEAFREGTPVVVRNLGGMPEMVQASGAGFTYETEAQLVDILQRLASDPALRADLSRRAVRAYRERWTAAVHIDRYERLIEDLLSRRDRSSA